MKTIYLILKRRYEEQIRLISLKLLLRLVNKACRFNNDDILLAREISIWQDKYDSNAPTCFKRHYKMVED